MWYFLFFYGISRIETKYSSHSPLLVEEGRMGWWGSNAI